MENLQWYNIAFALLLGVMLWRIVPAAKNWLENGPRGDSKDWMTTAMLLGGVALFVVFLISTVRG